MLTQLTKSFQCPYLYRYRAYNLGLASEYPGGCNLASERDRPRGTSSTVKVNRVMVMGIFIGNQ